MASTRGSHTCPVYDIASELSNKQLSTVGDTMRFYDFVKYNLPGNTESTEIISKVTTEVSQIWTTAGIPTVSSKRIGQKIESIRRDLKEILKKKGESKCTAVSVSRKESLCLFDIAACHCVDLSECSCPKNSKVPVSLLKENFLQIR